MNVDAFLTYVTRVLVLELGRGNVVAMYCSFEPMIHLAAAVIDPR